MTKNYDYSGSTPIELIQEAATYARDPEMGTDCNAVITEMLQRFRAGEFEYGVQGITKPSIDATMSDSSAAIVLADSLLEEYVQLRSWAEHVESDDLDEGVDAEELLQEAEDFYYAAETIIMKCGQ